MGLPAFLTPTFSAILSRLLESRGQKLDLYITSFPFPKRRANGQRYMLTRFWKNACHLHVLCPTTSQNADLFTNPKELPMQRQIKELTLSVASLDDNNECNSLRVGYQTVIRMTSSCAHICPDVDIIHLDFWPSGYLFTEEQLLKLCYSTAKFKALHTLDVHNFRVFIFQPDHEHLPLVQPKEYGLPNLRLLRFTNCTKAGIWFIIRHHRIPTYCKVEEDGQILDAETYSECDAILVPVILKPRCSVPPARYRPESQTKHMSCRRQGIDSPSVGRRKVLHPWPSTPTSVLVEKTPSSRINSFNCH